MTLCTDVMPVSAARLVNHLVDFGRHLREVGVPVGTGEILDAVQAVALINVRRRSEFAAALSACLLRDPAHGLLFDSAFERFFAAIAATNVAGPEVDEAEAGSPLCPRSGDRRLGVTGDLGEQPAHGATVSRLGGYSRHEHLQHKDFEQLSREEFALTQRLVVEAVLPANRIPSRRFVADDRGKRIDLRRSLRLMVRHNGDLLTLARRRRREQTPALVLLCDVSGSMSSYSRMFLVFAHALQRHSRRVHSFAFGTRLTNVSRYLREPDADDALARVAEMLPDREGGTRIAASLGDFNRRWARRVTAQNASVILLTDGLERDTEADLQAEVARLRRSCRQLFWLNPMLRFDGFEPLAYGVRTMLPHVDCLLPGHNLKGLKELISLLSRSDRSLNMPVSGRP